MPRVKRMEAKHVESFVAQVGLHDLGDVAIMSEGHMHVFKAAVGFVDSTFALILRNL